MDLKDRRSLERELNELKKSYRDILNSNIKLSDELRWIKEDIQREIYKLKYTYIDDKIAKEEIINDLEKILKVNNWFIEKYIV